MTTRCEYCGQLYDGLSCPHCGAPRGDDKCAIYADGIIYWTSDGVVQSEETDHVGMSESDGVVQSEETDHVGMSERKRAKKIAFDMLVSIAFPLVLASLFVAFLILILVLIKSC